MTIRKSLIGPTILALGLASGTAFAYECPKDWKAIDAKLAENPQLSQKDMKAVEELRAVGEQLHKDGKHHASVAVLHRAMEILGIR